MKATSKLTKIVGCLIIAGIMTASLPHKQSHAGGGGFDLNFSGVGEAIVLIVRLIKAESKEINKHDASGVTTTPDKTKSGLVDGARPLCSEVGGYESYVKRTKKLCRFVVERRL